MLSSVLNKKSSSFLIRLKSILKLGISKKTKILHTLNFLFLIFAICMQIYMVKYYYNKLPSFLIIISTISTVVYSLLSIINVFKTVELAETNRTLEDAKLYNKNLQLLHDNLRCFKHDIANTMQCIGGYIANDNMEGLKKYYRNVQTECNNINNLTALSPSLINDNGLYSLLTSKYYLAEKESIKFNVSICASFDKLNIPSFLLTRILGILLDNAIDAAKVSKEKEIYFEVKGPSNTSGSHRSVVSIENSYSNKNVDIDRIREKGYTSKSSDTGSHGLGLWEVNKMLRKSKNLNLYTSKNESLFRQQLEIYD